VCGIKSSPPPSGGVCALVSVVRVGDTRAGQSWRQQRAGQKERAPEIKSRKSIVRYVPSTGQLNLAGPGVLEKRRRRRRESSPIKLS
jgi:hypothetical protein